ncbi:hypothetical protein [Algoriphagus sp. CAU 1675]|uniref:hypothetical protein n=1 Tax=Algoriphagus sp. CAU 1675 TaxID=3032597 RepID=UPI0023DB6CC0|nr:hypothetical protein [Algoriphagus sp. CAU 1675]MDF2156710.1 hypothetical protein [Algoriphagus sp. CAU 1675]
MLTIPSIWLALGMLLAAPAKDKEVTRWKVSTESVVEILGSTNVNEFECKSISYQGQDYLLETFYPDRNQVEWTGEIVLSSGNFDCFNKLMTRDFYQTVKGDEHPEIRVRFLDLVRENRNSSHETLSGNVEITLAGVSRRFPITCGLISSKNGKAVLNGVQTVTFSEFQIDPPVKFFGTVKVQNAISVQFGLVLEEA